MTLDEFFVALEKERTRRWVIWRPEAAIRSGFLAERCRCPITAVAETACGMPFPPSHWRDAALVLGLRLDDARRVVAAADRPNAFDDRTLRPRILAALGLAPEAT